MLRDDLRRHCKDVTGNAAARFAVEDVVFDALDAAPEWHSPDTTIRLQSAISILSDANFRRGVMWRRSINDREYRSYAWIAGQVFRRTLREYRARF
jgi:hypothetical protein